MATVRELHNRAMEYAQQAQAAQWKNYMGYAKLLYHKAYMCEWGAARQLAPTAGSEPTRGILYRSAGWLAHNAGDLAVAETLAREGLAGRPVSLVQRELEELLEALQCSRD